MDEIKNNQPEETLEEVSEKEKALIEENESLIKENEELKKQADEFKDKWMRNVAEFDNYKKRNARIWQDAFNEGASSVVLQVLTVGDNLDRALSFELDEKTKEGVKNIKRQFDDVLKSLEVEEINPVGEPFDVSVAEAVMQVDGADGEKSDTVKQVFLKGYKIKDKLIRYAKVSVIK
ncbi:MAG: nucleotide exchange factor GrpE [Clostridia bacterium]|nr:nucleotide exchange factor GrpE [Clostridia bacterium]